jgi:hypothetical protein
MSGLRLKRYQLHFNMRREIGVKFSKENLHGNVPKSVQESDDSTVAILWNQQVQTDRMKPSNRLGRHNPLRKKEQAC